MSAFLQRYELLRKRRERFTRMLHGLERGNPRALHRARVASRRLREVLPVLELDADVARKLMRRLKKVTDRLGKVRELDVLLSVLDELAGSGRYSGAALGQVAAAVEGERAEALARLLVKPTFTELGRLSTRLEKLERGLEAGRVGMRSRRASARTAQWVAEARISRRASTLTAAMTAAGGMYLPDRLHDVRLAAKKLRYALEVASEITGAPMKADLSRLKRTQGVLGHLHDLQVLIDRVRQTQASLAPPDVGRWRDLGSLVVPLENECRRLHGQYMRSRKELRTLCTRLSGSSRSSEPRAEKLRVKRS